MFDSRETSESSNAAGTPSYGERRETGLAGFYVRLWDTQVSAVGDERGWVSLDAGCDVRAYSVQELDLLVGDETVMFDALEEVQRGSEMGALS